MSWVSLHFTQELPICKVEIEVERRFSLTKRCYGMGKIVTRLEDTQFTSIALSVFVANIVRMQQRILSALFYLLDILKFREGWLPAYAG